MSKIKNSMPVFILGMLMLVTSVISFSVLLFTPSFNGLPTQRLIITSASLAPPAVYFINFRAVLPPGKAGENAITTYWFCGAIGLLGAALSTEDNLTILVAVIVLVILVFRLLSWKRRVISTLVTALLPVPAIRLFFSKLGIEFEIPDGNAIGQLAVAALIAFIFVVRERP